MKKASFAVFWLLVALALPSGCLALVDYEETCADDYDCKSGYFCKDEHCINTCKTTADCGGILQTCDASAGVCREICSISPLDGSSDCPTGYNCTNGMCKPK